MRRILFLLFLALSTLTTRAALPAVEIKDAEGHMVSTDQLANDGQPFIIAFFATWCKPCMRELKAYNDLYPDWQQQYGLRIVIVSIDEAQDMQKVKPLVDGNDWDFDVLLDPNGDFKRAMNVVSIPHMFVLNGQGEIVYNHVGYTDGDEQNVEEALKKFK